MFIGHYGVSFALKKKNPKLSLSFLFLLVQLLDLLFFSFLLLGVEKMRIVPHFTAYNSYDLYFMPFSHGLIGALFWSLLAALAWRFFSRTKLNRPAKIGAMAVVALAVFSHWALDFPMHTPDLPILGNDSVKVGLGLWNSLGFSMLAELVVLLSGWFYYFRGTSKTDRARSRKITFLVVLLLLLLATPLLPAPTSTSVIAAQALVSYVGLAFFAGWSERSLKGKSS